MDLSKFSDYPLWVKVVGIIFLLSTMVLGFALLFIRPIKKQEQTTDSKLIIKAKILAQELFKFKEERFSIEPQIDRKNWDKSIQRQTKYNSETNTLYDSKFKARVLFAQEEFTKQNLSVKEFTRSMAEHPTNYIGLNIIASALDELALKLERSIK